MMMMLTKLHLAVSAVVALGLAALISSLQPRLHPSGVLVENIGWMTVSGLYQGQQEWDDVTAAAAALRANGSLRGKRVLVTGTTNGLGYGIAVQLISLGANVVSASRNHKTGFVATLLADAAALALDEGEAAAEFGPDAVRLVTLDLSDLDSVERAASELAEAGVVADVVILNAGPPGHNLPHSDNVFWMFPIYMSCQKCAVTNYKLQTLHWKISCFRCLPLSLLALGGVLSSNVRYQFAD